MAESSKNRLDRLLDDETYDDYYDEYRGYFGKSKVELDFYSRDTYTHIYAPLNISIMGYTLCLRLIQRYGAAIKKLTLLLDNNPLFGVNNVINPLEFLSQYVPNLEKLSLSFIKGNFFNYNTEPIYVPKVKFFRMGEAPWVLDDEMELMERCLPVMEILILDDFMFGQGFIPVSFEELKDLSLRIRARTDDQIVKVMQILFLNPQIQRLEILAYGGSGSLQRRDANGRYIEHNGFLRALADVPLLRVINLGCYILRTDRARELFEACKFLKQIDFRMTPDTIHMVDEIDHEFSLQFPRRYYIREYGNDGCTIWRHDFGSAAAA